MGACRFRGVAIQREGSRVHGVVWLVIIPAPPRRAVRNTPPYRRSCVTALDRRAERDVGCGCPRVGYVQRYVMTGLDIYILRHKSRDRA